MYSIIKGTVQDTASNLLLVSHFYAWHSVESIQVGGHNLETSIIRLVFHPNWQIYGQAETDTALVYHGDVTKEKSS